MCAFRASHAPAVVVSIMAVTNPWPAGPAPTRKLDRDRFEERMLDEPPSGPLVVVDAERTVYTEHWLPREGYAPRQFWTAK